MILEVTDPRGLEIFPAPGGRGPDKFVVLCAYRLNLVESQLWNETDWRGKYVGVVPRPSGSLEDVSFRIVEIDVPTEPEFIQF